MENEKETKLNDDFTQLSVDFRQLSSEFRAHEKVCEERWKSVHNEIREAKNNSNQDRSEIKESIRSIHRLIWTGGGALIMFLFGVLAIGNIGG